MSNSNKCKVFHSEVWGLRETKYDWLVKNDIKTTKWKKLNPASPYYFFVPREEKLLEDYEKHPKISELFPLNSVGLFTARDGFAIDMNKDNLLNRIRLFKNNKYSDDELHAFFQINRSKGWDIRKAWKAIHSISDSDLSRFILSILYRPFDIRWIFYHDAVVERSRKEVMRHMIQENLALCVGRAGQVVGLEKRWNIVFCSEWFGDLNLFYRGGNVNFPLYLYPDTDKKDLFSQKKKSEKRQPNINPKVFATLTEVYRKEPTPEEVFYYIYAVLYSNIYRTKYSEFLKIDFPRIPFTKDYKLFSKMAEYGKELVDLHLVGAIHVGAIHESPLPKFQGKGDNSVEKIKFEKGKVYINKDQYFESIGREIWEYQIGGYQVLSKWLKDRKKRKLSLEDIKHYCKVVTVLDRTIQIQKIIDELYPQIEKSS